MTVHIFLTGDIQIGKSTVLEKVLTGLGQVRLGGFRTVKVADCPDAVGSVYLVPAAEHHPAYTDANRVAVRFGSGWGAAGYPDAFDAAGIAALRGAEDCDILLMDEIGKLERNATAFSARIEALLDGDVPIFGVVRKEGETPLLQRVRSHPRVRVIEVTAQNRDTLPGELLPVLLAKIGK